jgi:drug/metabolite transporter (DMT)-like permease
LISGGIGILLLSFIAEDHSFGIKPAAYYISLFYLGFLSAAAFSIWFVLLKRPGIKVSEINIWKFLIPVFGAILSWIILPDEKPALIPVIGMILITFSLILLNYNNGGRFFSGRKSEK